MKSLSLSLAVSSLVAATATAADTPPSAIEEITVTGVRERLYEAGMLKNVIQKTEVVSALTMEKRNAGSLTEAIAFAPGVRVNNECSMCGVKRVMINGLRGEHTTVLIDGIPAHTMMSGFYGLDAAAAAGLERIELARGTGASLIAPEAIGGTINLVTREADRNGLDLDLAGGELGYEKASAVATALANGETTRLTLSGQYLHRDQYDGDDNAVSESPAQTHESFTAYLSQDLGDHDNLRLRASRVDSEIFGGPVGTDIGAVRAGHDADPDWASPSLFADGDVRNRFTGRPWETTEWIDTTRTELYGSWLHEFGQALNMSLTASHNRHEQDSFYEGFSYVAKDEMSFFDARVNWSLSQAHLLTAGADLRTEELRSTSNSTSAAYVSDSFDYDVAGFYLQDTWIASDRLELAAALRYDRVRANFVDLSKPGKEIDERILSPRLDIRYTHDLRWTSRLSFGSGYRAPLSFFESDHGILDAELGFLIDIEELERSDSLSYALSFEDERLTATGAIAWTRVENLAALSENDAGVPKLTQLDEDGQVLVADLALSWQLSPTLTIGGTVERIDYDDTFKSAFGVVPIEERLVLNLDWTMANWELFASATWIGERNLADYGTPAAPTFDVAGTLPMDRKAEAYWTVDLRVARHLGEHWHVYAGASNLLGYTQVEDGQTPLFFDGGAYDVAYLWGPLRGREAYLGIKYAF
ncbi:MAG: TonB-dependent receptor plug domain-containing protein [Chromatocurvus sp.]